MLYPNYPRRLFIVCYLNRHTTWELPGYVPFEATKELVLEHVQLWKEPLIDLFDDICHGTLGLIHKLIQDVDHFGRFAELQAFVKLVRVLSLDSRRRYSSFYRVLVEEERARLQTDASMVLEKIFNWDNGILMYTANRTIYDQARNTWLNQPYRNHYSGYNDEYKVMADVHAYFQVASAVGFATPLVQYPMSVLPDLSYRDSSTK